MRNIHIEDSYRYWTGLEYWIRTYCAHLTQGNYTPEQYLNRSMRGMVIEWYLHNIGYWITLPFIKNEKIKRLNERFKHLDLEEHF